MKKVTIFTILLIFVLTVSLSFAFGIPKLGKGKLKAADQELTLKDISPKLEKFMGTDSDPFKGEPYKINVYGDNDIDTFILSSHKITMTAKFGKSLMTDLNTKLAAATTKDEIAKLQDDAKVLQEVVMAATADSAKLVSSGTNLITTVPGKIKSNPVDAILLPKVLTSLKDALAALKASVTDITGLTGEIVKFIGEATTKTDAIK